MDCPFCHEGGFDDIGLHYHLVRDWCPEYGDVQDRARVEQLAAYRQALLTAPGRRTEDEYATMGKPGGWHWLPDVHMWERDTEPHTEGGE